MSRFELKLSDFDFELPAELIAQEPLAERDQSRLLHVSRDSGALRHHRVAKLPELLRAGDLLVVNNSRVLPARLRGLTESGASVEILLLRPTAPHRWEVLARPAKRLTEHTDLVFGGGLLRGNVLECSAYGKRTVEFSAEGDFHEILETIGRSPLPPYIKRKDDTLEPTDRRRYQTVYARERGSVAAPTAGLHFTAELLGTLQQSGVRYAELTLHVGYGTFQPIRTDRVEDHLMDSELYRIPQETARAIETARKEKGRVVAVGTTTVRALESAGKTRGRVMPTAGETRLFIYPGFRFQVVDALLTNFHLPESSLFLLVAAFGGVSLLKRTYEEAIRQRYRFYSYGDCMLIT